VSFIGGVSGDFDGDQEVDARDIDILFDVIHAGTNVTYYDLDNSGAVNDGDVDALLSSLGSSYGDATLDGTVNAMDLNRFALNWQSTQCGTWEGGDFNGDKRVDVNDLNLIGLHWQPPPGTTAQDPRQRVPRAPLANRHVPTPLLDVQDSPGEHRAPLQQASHGADAPLRHASHRAEMRQPSEGQRTANDGPSNVDRRLDRTHRSRPQKTAASRADSKSAEAVTVDLLDTVFATVDRGAFSRRIFS
jgi:hypothetical protein